MKKATFKLMALTVATSVMLFACGGDEQPETAPEAENATEEVSMEDIEFDNSEEDVTYMLPSPLQIVSLFKNAGLEYVGGITNPKENVNNYNSKYNQKLNFGVYAADMAYTLTNNQTQESINYLNTLRELSEKIWLTDVINSMGVAERLEKNVGNEDSLTYIMADLQMELDQYLDENGASYAGNIIFSGAWVETMYLALNGNTNNPEVLGARISEQAVILENIIAAVKQANEDKEFDEYVTSLEGVHAILVEEMNDERMEALKIAVTDLRTNLING